jgi:hypothetical protein
MGRVWVLDTETKGTGAEMVPLDKVQRRPAPERKPIFVPGERRERPPQPKPPARFKVVDVMTRQVLAEDAGARATLDVLKSVRRSADVHVHAWEGGRWRLLTLPEQRALWELRER